MDKKLGKEALKTLLRSVGLYKHERGQFWGWARTRSEYCDLMRAAGCTHVEDGFIETPNQRTYFIRSQI